MTLRNWPFVTRAILRAYRDPARCELRRALAALGLFGPVLERIIISGVDVLATVDVAKARFAEHGLSGAFMQIALNRLPLPDNTVHGFFPKFAASHRFDARWAGSHGAASEKNGGRILFQPLSLERTDAGIHRRLHLRQAAADVARHSRNDRPPDIPAGQISLQRFFYRHALKAFHRPKMSLDEMNQLNFDWYAPKTRIAGAPKKSSPGARRSRLAIEHEAPKRPVSPSSCARLKNACVGSQVT